MQTKTILQVPTPCHESWNGMTPTDSGRFCAACSKQVVDFSLMTDQQVLHYLAGQSGKLCGRFSADQLNRPLTEPVVSRRRSWYLAVLLPVTLLFQKSFGQATKTAKNHRKDLPTAEVKPVLLQGAVAIQVPIPPPLRRTITGTITDENHHPLAGATISIQDNRFVASDSLGRFVVPVPSADSTVTLTASYVGYKTIQQPVRLTNDKEEITLTLPVLEAKLADVVVVDYEIVRRMGGLSICTRITKTQKLDTAIRKLVRMNACSVYPNPAPGGSIIHISPKKAGAYEVQLLTGSSALLTTGDIHTGEGNAVASFLLPNQVAAGVYYLRIIDEATKQSSLEKLVIQ